MDEQNWDNEWLGFEPEQPRSGQCGCWLAALFLFIALSGTCIGTGYFAWRQLDLPINPGLSFLHRRSPLWPQSRQWNQMPSERQKVARCHKTASGAYRHTAW